MDSRGPHVALVMDTLTNAQTVKLLFISLNSKYEPDLVSTKDNGAHCAGICSALLCLMGLDRTEEDWKQ